MRLRLLIIFLILIAFAITIIILQHNACGKACQEIGFEDDGIDYCFSESDGTYQKVRFKMNEWNPFSKSKCKAIPLKEVKE